MTIAARPAWALTAALVPVLAGCGGHRGPPGPAATGAATMSPAASGPAATGRNGLPRYYAALVDTAHSGESIQVHETATGRVTGTMPVHDAYFPGLLAAAGDHRTFFLANPQRPSQIPSASPAATGIYRFRLTASGQITGFTEVAHGHADASGMLTIAASPDGQKIAMSDAAAGLDAIAVADLATGRQTVWRGGLPAGFRIRTFTWEAGDRTLAFLASGAPSSAGYVTEVRTLDTSTAGGSLAASRRIGTVDLPEGVGGTVLSPDGRTVTYVQAGSPNSHGESPTPPDEVIQISVATGHQTVIYRAASHATIASGDDFGSEITSDGDGHLLQGGGIGGEPYSTGVELAWTGGGKLHWLPSGSGFGQQITYTDFAW